MGGFDDATWQALGLVLTVAGLAVSVLVWVRRGAVSGLRAVAWSLLPLAAGLTGVLRLAWEVADAVGTWATRLAFSPVVWLGLAIAAVSVVLFVLTAFLRRRQGCRSAGEDRSRAGPRAVSSAGPSPAQGDPELADIEELLRRRGIS